MSSNFHSRYYQDYWSHRIKTKKISSNLTVRSKLIVKHLRQNTIVLDIGCGDGLLGRGVKNQNYQISLDGIDIASNALKLATPYYRNLWQLDIQTAKKLPSSLENYDTIVACEIIEHLLEPEKLLQFAKSHLKKNGQLLITFPNTAWWKYRWDLMIKGKFIDENPSFTYLDHLHFFTLHSLPQLLKQNGFRVVGIDAIYTLPWYLGRLPARIQAVIGQINTALFGYQILLVCQKSKSAI